jgi:hypothetical protein
MGPTAPLPGGDNRPDGGDRPRRLLLLASVLAVLVIAIVVFASVQGGGEVSLNPIAQAAVRTQESPGARALFRATAHTKSGSGVIEMSGQGAYNGQTDRSEMTITAHGPTGEMKLRAVAGGTHMYFKSKAFQSELPGDDEWMGLDLSQYTQSDPALSSNSDPSSQLDLLKSASDEFETLGKETIRGVKTTGYRGTLDTGLEFETWIDGKGLVRRMRIKGSPSEPGAVDMTVDFYDFGISPEIELPDPDTVFDATDLAGSAGGAG